jgi:hypothetical protein
LLLYHANNDENDKQPRKRREHPQQPDNNRSHNVNVTTIAPVPAFASDSEEEDQVFDYGPPRVKNVIAVKGGQKSSSSRTSLSSTSGNNNPDD